MATRGFYTPIHSPPSSPPAMPALSLPSPRYLDPSDRSVGSLYSDATLLEGNDNTATHNNSNNNSLYTSISDSDDEELIPTTGGVLLPTNSPTQQPPIPPLKLLRPRSYTIPPPTSLPQTLTHVLPTRPKPKHQLNILLALTPRPASRAEHTFFSALSARFCADFGAGGEEWGCVSLYAHLRGWLERFENGGEGMDVDGEGEGEVGIGGIHPYALRAKLAQEREVQWRLGVPVLLGLIEMEVRKGRRALVVCGLGVGGWEGVRAFAEKIAEPNGVLAFLPVVDAGGVVPPEFESRTVTIRSTDPTQIYDALLAALYAKNTTSSAGEVNEPILIDD